MRRLAAVALLALLCAAPLAAQDSLEASKRQELERVQRQAREKREAATRLKGQETQALGQLRRTERELNLTRKRLRTLNRRRQQLNQELEVTRASLARTILTLEQQRYRLAHRLRGLYKFGPARELEFLLSTRSFAELLTRWDYLVMVAEEDRVLLENVRSEREQIETDKRLIEDHLSDVRRTTRRTATENQRLADLRQTRASTVETIQSQRQAYEAAAAELERTAKAIQRLLAQLERRRKEEADRARAEGRNPQPYTGDFARGEGALDWPLRGDLVGRFGPETHPRYGTTTLNNGIDIRAAIGTAVHAVARGRVDYVSEDYSSYGQIVIVNHGDGFYTLYAHLSEILVSVGQEVTAGQVIARSGDSGSLKGSILHFEVRKGGTALNPEDWLR